MSLTFNGTSAFLELAAAISTTRPITLFARIKPSGSTATQGIMSVGKSGTTGYSALITVSGTTVRAQEGAIAGGSFSAAITGLTTGAWQAVMGRFNTTADRSVSRGANTFVGNTNTLDSGIGTHDRFRVGDWTNSASRIWFSGDIAEVAAWAGNISQADYDAIVAGALPETISTGTLIDVWPLVTQAATQVGIVNGLVLTATATTQGADHPVTRSGPTETVTLTGLASAEAFGALTGVPHMDGQITLAGLPSGEAFGALTVTPGDITYGVNLSGIASAEAFGALAAIMSDRSYEIRANGKGTTASQPKAVCRGGYTYASWVEAGSGSVGVTKYNNATGAVQHFTLSASFQDNSHNSPSMLFLPDGRLLAFYSKHNDTTGLRYRITTAPEDITAWAAEVVVTSANPVTYSNPHYLSLPNRYYVHYRGNPSTRGRSSADLATWGSEQTWVSNSTQWPYTVSRSNGRDRIDFFFSSGHPNDTAPSMYHAYMTVDAAGVETWHKSDGTVITTPATPANATLVYDGSTIKAFNPEIKLDRHGHPWCLWQTFPTPGVDHRHVFSRWTGSSWTPPVEICPTGGPRYSIFAGTPNYADGYACFDAHNPCIVYASITRGPVKLIEEWRTDDEGETWYYVRTLSGNASATLSAYLPNSPDGHDGRAGIVFFYGTDGGSISIRAADTLRVEVTMTDRTGATPAASLTGLDYAVFDAPLPGDSAKLLATGTDGYTDASGIFRAATSGATSSAAFVVVTDSDGNPESNHNAFAGPVAVI